MSNKCSICKELIKVDELGVIYDGEPAHISCAAEDIDNAGFDDERDND
jgi:hypothetical protein